MVSLKQPFEDVTHKIDDYYAKDAILNDTRISLMVGKLANSLRRAYLNQIHNYATGDKARLMWETMSRPRIGDLVFVSDMFYRRNQDELEMMQAVGYLIEHRDEWATTDAEWEKSKAEDNYLADDQDRRIERDVYYIQYGPNLICRWVNSSVYAVIQEEVPDEPARGAVRQVDVFSNSVGQVERTIHDDSHVTYRHRNRCWDGTATYTPWKEGKGE